MSTRIPAMLGAAAILAALLVGCAEAPDSPVAPPDPTGHVTPGSPGATMKPTPTVTTGDLTIVGRISAGVEAGCTVLTSGTRTYLLIVPDQVDDRALRATGSVAVRGHLQPDRATICQQGTPFVVSEIRPA